mmetsp:Transcript_1016/g.1466  ORF Transcript_1016/g.1466 Transcript_1016/m.1466 type:complete len:867 (-) Transcript_1016:303-2903(-)
MKTILIGKGRRITLEELYALDNKDAAIQLFHPDNLEEVPAEEEVGEQATLPLATLILLTQNLAQERLMNPKLSWKWACTMAEKCIPSGTLPSQLEESLPSAMLERTKTLATACLSLQQAKMLSQIATPIAAFSVERHNLDFKTHFAEVKFDVHRPHRSLMEEATTLRTLLEGSKVANKPYEPQDGNGKLATSKIPQMHGPALDAILAACKTLELELNCYETSSTELLDMTLAEMALSNVIQAVSTLLIASCARTNKDAPTTSSLGLGLVEMAKTLKTLVSQLQAALEEETKIGIAYMKEEIAKLAQDQKGAEKAGNEPQGPQKKENEFEGLSEEKIAKILKERAKKEAKKKAKQAAKSKRAVSLFSPGTMQMMECFAKDSCLSSQAVVLEVLRIVEFFSSGGVRRKPKIAKGTRDYMPEQMMIREEAFQIIRRVFRAHGAVEIDTPVFERKETLTGKYGEDSKLIYDLADQGGELLALRYDLTVPFARFLSLHSVGNIKRFHIGKVYRRDQPALARGRYREFYQCDFDIAGVYGRMVPDSECLAVVCDILDALPIGDFGVKLNHRRLLDAILDICGVPSDKFRTICSAVDKLDKSPWEEVKREMVEDKGLAEDVADKIGTFVVEKGEPLAMYNKLMDGKRFGSHAGALDAMEDLRILFEYLGAMDKLKFISFDLSLARGLDYYTGVIYEAVCMSGKTQVGSIGGGGRYDNLVSMFQESGKLTPCVGVSVGIERVFTLMEARVMEKQGGTLKQPSVTVLVASIGDGMMKERMKLTKTLWNAKISAEFSQKENPKLKFEIASALDRSIPFMVIVGEEELKENKCKIKDLNAEQEELVLVDDLVSTLLRKGVIPVGCEYAAEFMKQHNA